MHSLEHTGSRSQSANIDKSHLVFHHVYKYVYKYMNDAAAAVCARSNSEWIQKREKYILCTLYTHTHTQ